MPESNGTPEPLREKARRWEEAWGLPGLLASLTVEFSTRMRVSLGLCRPVQVPEDDTAGRGFRHERRKRGTPDCAPLELTLSRGLLDPLRKISVWKRGSRRAPHKPLLLLLALAEVQRGGARTVGGPTVGGKDKDGVSDLEVARL